MSAMDDMMKEAIAEMLALHEQAKGELDTGNFADGLNRVIDVRKRMEQVVVDTEGVRTKVTDAMATATLANLDVAIAALESLIETNE